MKKFLIGLVAGLLLAGLACLIVFFAVARLTERRPSIPSEATLVFRLDGDLPEQAPTEIPIPIIASQAPATVYETWDLLRKAAADQRIKAILFEPQGVTAGWAKLAEVRADLLEFKKSGKPLIAYLQGPGAREYYLATAADKIYLSQEDVLDLKGLRAEAMFFRRTLDKLGVGLEVQYAGKYKDAADEFLRTSMTPETREVTESILDTVYGHLVDTIASARGKTADQVRATIDQGPFLADQAQSAGLIDGLLFEDQVWDQVKARLNGKETQKVSDSDYNKIPASSLKLDGDTKIAMIVAEGAISRGGSIPLGGEEGIRSSPFIHVLREVADDNSIRGVILRIDSPGGDAIASDEILHAVKNLSAKKPTVISMSDMAASGGYYMAMSGDPILAYSNTYTGSIGVLYGKVNLAQLFDKVGVDVQILTRGDNAAIDTVARPLTDSERAKLREGVEQVYHAFLARVSEGRKKPVSEIEPLAQGRVWMGVQAKNNGLVDQLGGLDQAIALVKQRAKLAPTDKVAIALYPRKRSLFEEIFENSGEELFSTATRSRLSAVRDLFGIDPGVLALFERGGILRLPPYTIRID